MPIKMKENIVQKIISMPKPLYQFFGIIERIVTRVKNSKRLKSQGIALLDQIMFSAGNFTLTVTLARYFSDIQVAGYGIGLSVGLMLQHILWTVYVIKNSVMPPKKFLRRADKVVGEHLVFLLTVLSIEMILSLIFLAFWPGEWSITIVTSVVVCTLIYLHLDFERIVCLKHNKTHILFWTSAIFFMMNLFLFFAVPRLEIPYIVVMLLICLFSIGKITHLVTLVKKPNFEWGIRMAEQDLRRHAVSSLLGASGGLGYFHLPVFLISKLVQPVEAAAFFALRGLMQPAMILIRSLDVIDKNLFSSKSHSHADIRHSFLRQVPLYLVIALGTILMAIFLGKPFLSFFYGDRYMDFSGLLIGWASAFSFMMILPPIDTVMVKMGRVRQFNYIRMYAGICGAIAAFFLCPLYGAVGAVFVTIFGCAFLVFGGLWLIRDVLRGHH